MDRIYFKEHKGFEIYYVDFSNIQKEEEFLDQINISTIFKKEHIETKDKKSQLMFIDITNSSVVGSIFKALKDVILI